MRKYLKYLLVLLAVAAVWLFGGSVAGPRDEARAAGPFDLTGVRCTDIYLDAGSPTPKGSPPDPDDLQNVIGKALTRIEPGPGGTIAVKILGYGSLTPGTPIAPTTCAGEQGDHNRVSVKHIFPNDLTGHLETRAQLVDKSVPPDGVPDFLRYTTCFLVEYLALVPGGPNIGPAWIRNDTNEPLLKVNTTKDVFYGENITHVKVASPTDPSDPTTCGPVSLIGLDIRLVTVNHERDAATDDPGQVSAQVVADPNGPAGTPPPLPQTPDADTIADDWDGDGCTDWDELGLKVGPGDPFNGLDCDTNFNAISNILAIDQPATKTAPGAYFNCIADSQTGAGAPTPVTIRLYCYTDHPLVGVNPHEAGVCVPPGGQPNCGDGLRGATSPPPPPYGEVHDAHTQLTGTIDAGNVASVAGCFNNVHSVLGPGVYVRATVNLTRAKGTVDIWFNRTPADCKAGNLSAEVGTIPVAPLKAQCANGADDDGDGVVNDGCPAVGPAESGAQCGDNADNDGDNLPEDGCFPKAGGENPPNSNDRVVHLSEMPKDFDHDRDNCTDKQELRDNFQQGGLRDPYNVWDFMSVHAGAPPAKDRVVDVSDIVAVVDRFGTTDSGPGPFNRNSDPKSTPPPNVGTGRERYHPSYDRGDPIPNGLPPGTYPIRREAANGAVDVGDIVAVVDQFGHSCAG